MRPRPQRALDNVFLLFLGSSIPAVADDLGLPTLLLQAVLMAVALGLWIFIRLAPPSPPTYTTEDGQDARQS